MVGAKIDFFDHEHKEVVDLYTALLKDAAKYHILVNFHGATSPRASPAPGRTNWSARPSRHGGQQAPGRARHDATLPFTRYLAGHADYTPVHFGARRNDTTWRTRSPRAAVLTSPLLVYGAHPRASGEPRRRVIKSIPSVWDETIVLPVSEIGEVAAFARRSGDMWFLAVVNGPTARTVNIPLSFLGEGVPRDAASDSKDDAAALQVEERNVKGNEPLAIELSSGGGFIARFTKP